MIWVSAIPPMIATAIFLGTLLLVKSRGEDDGDARAEGDSDPQSAGDTVQSETE